MNVMNKIIITKRSGMYGVALVMFVLLLHSSFLQAQVNDAYFQHKEGESFNGLMDNGMQKVHEYPQVVYIASGSSRILQGLQQVSREYARWYNYETDNGLPWGAATPVVGGLSTNGISPCDVSGYSLLGSPSATATDNRGVWRAKDCVPSLRYTQTTPASAIKIAIDQSTYTDKVFPSTGTKIEPTLSQRIIFDVRPAQEMVDALIQCTGDVFLEDYEMIAPAGKKLRIGPQYAYMDTVSPTTSSQNTVYNISNYFIADSEAGRIKSGAVWKKNGVVLPTYSYAYKSGIAPVNNQVTNGRLLQTLAGAAGTTDVYTLTYTTGGTTYNIARFIINNQAVSAVGPLVADNTGVAVISDSEIESDYTVISGRDFDFGLPDPTNTDIQRYDTTLQLSESNYGYANFNVPRNTNADKLPAMAEYYFVNRLKAGIQSHVGNLKHRTGADNGYFMYIDAADDPGVAMNMEFSGEMCPNATLAFSAWIANLDPRTNGHLSPVNLNFIVIGVDESGNETPLTTYTTGDISVSQKWHQIFFDIHLNSSYSNYRLRIVNNGFASLGNNLAIDDIKVLLKQPPIVTYQTSINCNPDNDTVVSVIRLTYDELEDNGWLDKTIYYQWFNENTDSVLDLDYLNKLTTNNDIYGSFQISSGTVPAADVYQYAETFLADTDPDKHVGYVYETINNTTYLRIYIKHFAVMHKNSMYTARVAVDVSALSDTVCGVFSSMQIHGATEYMLDGATQNNVVTGLCGDQQYESSLQIYGVDEVYDNDVALVAGECLCDWLAGNPKQDSDEENIARYGYTYTQMQVSIQALRNIPEYYTVTNLDDVVLDVSTSSSLDDDKMNILRNLVDSGFLSLAQKVYSTQLTLNDRVQFTIFPIVGTGVSIADPNVHIAVCPNEIEVDLEALHVGADTLLIGSVGEKIPTSIENDPRILRMSAAQANATIPVPIKKSVNSIITQINMVSATDPAVTETISFLFDNPTPVVTDVSDTVTLRIYRTSGNTFEFKGGYEYHFEISKNTITEDCTSDKLPFTLKIVPDTALWVPTSAVTSWNNDANWRTSDYMGNNVRAGYTPMSHTKVIIPSGTAGSYPNLYMSDTASDTTQVYGMESGAQQYISHDLYFQANTCDNIYFESDAAMLNQHLLNYNSAWVDIAMPTYAWTLISSPLKGVVSGDFYIPSTGNVAEPFKAGTVDSRMAYYVWQRLYSSSTNHMTGRGDRVEIISSTWTSPYNLVSEIFTTGKGGLIKVEPVSAEETAVFKLPKADTEYSYYTTSDVVTDIVETITRPSDYGKLSYEPTGSDMSMNITLTNTENSTVFLLGNPTMAYIHLKDFFTENTNLSGIYYLLRSVDNSGNILLEGCTAAGSAGVYLAPKQAMLVESNSSVSSLNVKLPTSILSLGNASSLAKSKSAVKEKAVSEEAKLLITGQYNGTYSQLTIMENSTASDGVVKGEDADLLMFSPDITPAALYTIADNTETGYSHYLSISKLQTLSLLPIAYHVIDDSYATTIELKFEGASTFSSTLQLFDAYTGITTILDDETVLTLEYPGNNVYRYFIQAIPKISTENNDMTTDVDAVSVYVAGNNTVVVNSWSTIHKVDVYNMIGQCVNTRSNVNDTMYNVHLSQGIYILRIETENGLSSKRVIVK